MQPKPAHLAQKYGAQFQDATVADAYAHRPPYPAETFDVLAQLLVEPRTVLDAGTGRGEIARPLARIAARVDAVDASAAMIAHGKLLPGGDAPNVRWLLAPAETARLDPPYGLITTAASLHWMEWSVVMPRFRAALASGAYLAILANGALPLPWDDELGRIITHYSTNRDYRPYDLIAELVERGLFQPAVDERQTTPISFAQPLDAYVESFHARNGFSRDRMPSEDAAAFDAAVRDLVAPYIHDGEVHMEIIAHMVWGHPLEGAQ